MKFWKLASAVAALVVSTSTNAALVGRLAATEGGADYQAYYDTEADLTWLADADAAGGVMNLANANAWATTLDVEGVTGWRLPTTLQPDESCDGDGSNGVWLGYNCTGSEMGNLFYNVLGGTAASSIATSHNANYDLFINVHSYHYWTSTEYLLNTNHAWYFKMNSGFQGAFDKEIISYAWAVHDGDVAALSSVPVPAAVWLFGSGLIGLAGIARRKKA